MVTSNSRTECKLNKNPSRSINLYLSVLENDWDLMSGWLYLFVFRMFCPYIFIFVTKQTIWSKCECLKPYRMKAVYVRYNRKLVTGPNQILVIRNAFNQSYNAHLKRFFGIVTAMRRALFAEYWANYKSSVYRFTNIGPIAYMYDIFRSTMGNNTEGIAYATVTNNSQSIWTYTWMNGVTTAINSS